MLRRQPAHGDRDRDDADQGGPAAEDRQRDLLGEDRDGHRRADQIGGEQEQGELTSRIELRRADPRPLRRIGAVGESEQLGKADRMRIRGGGRILAHVTSAKPARLTDG